MTFLKAAHVPQSFGIRSCLGEWWASYGFLCRRRESVTPPSCNPKPWVCVAEAEGLPPPPPAMHNHGFLPQDGTVLAAASCNANQRSCLALSALRAECIADPPLSSIRKKVAPPLSAICFDLQHKVGTCALGVFFSAKTVKVATSHNK